MGASVLKQWASTGWRYEVGNALFSVFFPSDCHICKNPLLAASRIPICDSCFQSFQPIPLPVCLSCGQPLPMIAVQTTNTTICPTCQVRPFAFDRARSFAFYRGHLVRAILMLKFDRIDPLGR